ncbi:MAG: HAD family hydrolase [Gammaproteobacteria bacterium]
MKPHLHFALDPGVEKLLTPPKVILFDWHATLVDTLEAMYHAVDEVLPQLDELGLLGRLVASEISKTPEDARLVEYVRSTGRLHPKIKAERKISRTDIFEVLFGQDEDAKHIAHEAFNVCYRNHFGEVHPFEGNERDMLLELHEFDVRIGVLTNRDREFFEHELSVVENGSWVGLFDVAVCGSDSARRKPAPEPIYTALEQLGVAPSRESWYVGDSTTDIIAANRAGITGVFFNGAKWDHGWLEKIFPGTPAHPHLPDVVVDSFREFIQLCERCLHISPAERDAALRHAHEVLDPPWMKADFERE